MKNGRLQAAYETMAAEVEATIQSLNDEGAQAFKEGNYERARALMEKGPALLEFQSRLNALWEEWRSFLDLPAPQVTRSTQDSGELPAEPDPAVGANGGVRSGEEDGLRPPDARMGMAAAPSTRNEPEAHTSEEKFVVPVLQALVSLGGSGTSDDVIDQVGEIMKARLRPPDFQASPGDPDKPRWRHSAEWACEAMLKEGFLVWDDSQGSWQVTEIGKKWLAKQFEKA